MQTVPAACRILVIAVSQASLPLAVGAMITL